MTALGYVHAQDRLWQMELMRRIAPGRLSEIFGSALKNDTFFAGLGIEEASESDCRSQKNSESYKLTMGYLDGINQYMRRGSIEFQLVGVKRNSP
jgi:penicillin amidase